MARISTNLLRGWDRVWQIPELWLLASQQADVDADAVARLVAAHEGRTLPLREGLARLLALGEFAAAEELLAYPAFRSAAPADLVERYQREELPQGRQAAYLEAANRYLTLSARAQQIGLSLPTSPAAEAHRSRRTAAEQFAQLEAQICDREQPLIADLERRLAVRVVAAHPAEADRATGGTPQSAWESAVRAAIEGRDLPLAAALLEQPAGSLYAPLGDPVHRIPIVASLPLLLDWFLERVPHPAGLEAFIPAPQDHAARSMLAALAALLRLEPMDWVLADVETFVATLVDFLGTPLLSSVREEVDGFAVQLPALAAPGVPALGPAALPRGIEMRIPRAGGRVPPAPGSWIALFQPEGLAGYRAGVLRFNGADLLSLCALPGNRAAGLAKILAADLPLDCALPWTEPDGPEAHRRPLPEPDTLVGRDAALMTLRAQMGLSIVIGGPGSGKTALLRRYAAGFARDAVWHLSSAELRTLESRLPDYVSLLVVDDADESDAAAGELVEERLRALLLAAGRPVRAVMAKRWRWPVGADLQLLNLGPLSFADSRQVARTLLDPLNVSLEGRESLDRVAFLAGGNPALLRALLDAILARRGGDSPRGRRAVWVSVHDVTAAWHDPVFREDAAAIIGSAFSGHEALRRTLAAVVIAGNHGALGDPYSASMQDVSDALELIEETSPERGRLAADLGVLAQMGLVQPGERLRLPLTGIAEICGDVVRSIINAA